MIRIIVNHDRIAAPVPVRNISEFPRRDAPVPSVEPEPAWSAAGQTKGMAKASREMSVRIGMIQMKARIICRRMPHPRIRPCIHMWCIRMACMVLEVLWRAMRLGRWVTLLPRTRCRCPSTHTLGSMRGNMPAAYFWVPTPAMFISMLRVRATTPNTYS